MYWRTPLQWRHNERDGVSNHRRLHCLLNPLLRHISKKTSKLRVIGLCDGEPRATCGFLSQRVRKNKQNSIWWRYHWLEKYQHGIGYVFTAHSAMQMQLPRDNRMLCAWNFNQNTIKLIYKISEKLSPICSGPSLLTCYVDSDGSPNVGSDNLYVCVMDALSCVQHLLWRIRQ